MSKRFIDTELFDDSWFMDLSKDGKLLWIYCLTKCNHAGIVELNEKLCRLQTGINSLETVIKELSKCLISIKDNYFLIPKYFEYQYPTYPEKSFRAAESAVNELKKFDLWDEENNKIIKTYLTVSKDLTKSYSSSSSSSNGSSIVLLPFKSENFKKQWILWKDYKSKEHKFKYKTPQSEMAALKELINLANGKEEEAIEIIHHSMGNGWKGFFKPTKPKSTWRDKA